MKQLTTIVIGIFLFTTTYAHDTSLFNTLQYKEVGFNVKKILK